MTLREELATLLPSRIDGGKLPPPMHSGKVRHLYEQKESLILVHTDKVSAFDRAVGTLPGKGALLATLSAWWFQNLPAATPHHFLEQPDPNILICRKLKMIPVEVVVRAYLTGSTQTSIWSRYQKGERHFGGITLPDGLGFNDELPEPILTPTTKDPAGDRNLEPAELIGEGWVTKSHWDKMAERALKIFTAGRVLTRARGIELVDTKYEFGIDEAGEIVIADELHTPDSSRFWKMGEAGRAHYDKEALRLWLRSNADPYGTAALPTLPDELCLDLMLKYTELYQAITESPFQLKMSQQEPTERILSVLNPLLELSKNK